MSVWVTEKMAGHCGARLSGVSLSNATNADLEKMRSALFAHGVIVMPGQNLTPKDHIRLAEFFGDIDVNRFFTPVSDYSVIAEVRTSADQSEVIGGTWHTDHSYDPAPAMCSILALGSYRLMGGYTFCFNGCRLSCDVSWIAKNVMRFKCLAFRQQLS